MQALASPRVPHGPVRRGSSQAALPLRQLPLRRRPDWPGRRSTPPQPRGAPSWVPADHRAGRPSAPRNHGQDSPSPEGALEQAGRPGPQGQCGLGPLGSPHSQEAGAERQPGRKQARPPRGPRAPGARGLIARSAPARPRHAPGNFQLPPPPRRPAPSPGAPRLGFPARSSRGRGAGREEALGPAARAPLAGASGQGRGDIVTPLGVPGPRCTRARSRRGGRSENREESSEAEAGCRARPPRPAAPP